MESKSSSVQFGGMVYVPPTNVPNISRFAIVADPQMATFAMVKGLKPRQEPPAGLGAPGLGFGLFPQVQCARPGLGPVDVLHVAQRAQAAFSNSRILGFVLNAVKDAPSSGSYYYYGRREAGRGLHGGKD